MRPIHPGEVLREEYLAPRGMTPAALAATMGVAESEVAALVAERAAVTPDMASKLASALGTTAEFWLKLQGNHEAAVRQLDA